MKMKSTPCLVLLLGLFAACGGDDDEGGEGALCQEECSASDDCASGYVCMPVGSITNRMCVPEECEQCVGKSCAVTAPKDGECTFQACM